MFSALLSISLRRKVIIGAAAAYLFMAGTILASYYFTSSLGEKISYLEDVSKLEESVLEIRRFEKNYFLYGDRESLNTALYHLQRVKSLYDKNVPKFVALSSPHQTAVFQENLAEYEKLLTLCVSFPTKPEIIPEGEARLDCESTIRKTGTAMVQFAEGVAKRKRDSIKETLSATVRLPVLGLLVVGCGLFAVGSFLFTKVTRSLRLLETGTAKMAQGDFEPIEPLPMERDIRNIMVSFNSMGVQLREREEQLVQSKKLAALGTMLAGVAHEVNNPLSNISSSCEILLEELDEADKEFQRQSLTKVLEQVERARTLILNLLEFSRTKVLRLEPVNLKQLIEKTLGQLAEQTSDGVQVKMEVDSGLAIYVDRQKIEQAFTNLISNAFHAVDGEGEVRIRAVAKRDGTIKIRISDTGGGIPEEDLPRIFDPFFTTKDIGKGTGLGLFITHDIILRHKGSIQVKSEQDKGAVFCVRLPAAESAQ